MPTVANMPIPPPRSWDEFQNIALSALRIRWRTHDLHHNGRSGQPQAGVDIYGRDDRGRPVGVQCKLTSGDLQLSTIEKEVAMAESFVPPIEAYFVATTSRRDAKIQQALRMFSQSRASRGQFEVAALFWEDLVSDLARDQGEFRKHYPELTLVGERSATTRPLDEVEKIFGPDFRPELGVQGDEWFRVRVYSSAFARPTFEPHEEDAFLDLVKHAFWEDIGAVLERADSDRVGVEHRDLDGRFHRRWVWWTGGDAGGTVGAIGMAGTLRELYRADAYSVAEMAIDMTRLLLLVGRMGFDGDYRVVVQIDPYRLIPAWDLSDLRARGQSEATLGGVVSRGMASNAHRTERRYEWSGSLRELEAQAAQLAGSAVVFASKNMHGARIESERLVASIPGLLDFASRVRSM